MINFAISQFFFSGLSVFPSIDSPDKLSSYFPFILWYVAFEILHISQINLCCFGYAWSVSLKNCLCFFRICWCFFLWTSSSWYIEFVHPSHRWFSRYSAWKDLVFFSSSDGRLSARTWLLSEGSSLSFIMISSSTILFVMFYIFELSDKYEYFCWKARRISSSEIFFEIPLE